MNHFKEYTSYDATGLAALVRNKDVSAEELLHTAINLYEERNPRLNAVVEPLFDYGLAAIKRGLPEGPFTGVPFLLKDSGALCAGTRTSYSHPLLANHLAQTDSEIVKRIKNCGFTIFGKSNVPEMSMSFVTESDFRGNCHNPWDLTLTPGGSSGGAASAVSAGIAPIAHGSDAGGSIRVPAACCGLVGLKPSRGLLPVGPEQGESLAGLSSPGFLTRSIRDTATIISAIAGTEVGAPYAAPTIDNLVEQPKSHTIGLMDMSDLVSDAELSEAVFATAKQLEKFGHKVLPVKVNIPFDELYELFITIVSVNCASSMRALCSQLNVSYSHDSLGTLLWTICEAGDQVLGRDYVAALNRNHALSRQIALETFAYDALLMPTLASLPPAIGSFSLLLHDLDALNQRSREFAPFTALWNQTGQPALSLPTAMHSQGLPIGVQLVGRFAADSLLLQLGRQLEKASKWTGLAPTSNFC